MGSTDTQAAARDAALERELENAARYHRAPARG